MTWQHDEADAPLPAGGSIFRSVQPSRRLTSGIAAQIAEAIRAGRLSPGDRLPTELQMMATFAVSRTVVREAVAALRADGFLVSKQGSGVFVADGADRPRFRLAPGGLTSLADVINMLELRTGVEVECASFAARRRTLSDLSGMATVLKLIDVALAEGRSAHDLDFQFHRLIAHAADNPNFPAFLDHIGAAIIPRRSVEVESGRQVDGIAYLRRSQSEHRALFHAIETQNAGSAARLMRKHIANGLQRYKGLAEEALPQAAPLPNGSRSAGAHGGRSKNAMQQSKMEGGT